MLRETPRVISDASDSVTNFFNSTGYNQKIEQLGQPPNLVYQSQHQVMYSHHQQETPSARTQLGNSSYAIPVKKTADPVVNDYSY